MPWWIFWALIVASAVGVAMMEPGYAILPLGAGIFYNGQVALRMAKHAKRVQDEVVERKLKLYEEQVVKIND